MLVAIEDMRNKAGRRGRCGMLLVSCPWRESRQEVRLGRNSYHGNNGILLIGDVVVSAMLL